MPGTESLRGATRLAHQMGQLYVRCRGRAPPARRRMLGKRKRRARAAGSHPPPALWTRRAIAFFFDRSLFDWFYYSAWRGILQVKKRYIPGDGEEKVTAQCQMSLSYERTRKKGPHSFFLLSANLTGHTNPLKSDDYPLRILYSVSSAPQPQGAKRAQLACAVLCCAVLCECSAIPHGCQALSGIFSKDFWHLFSHGGTGAAAIGDIHCSGGPWAAIDATVTYATE